MTFTNPMFSFVRWGPREFLPHKRMPLSLCRHMFQRSLDHTSTGLAALTMGCVGQGVKCPVSGFASAFVYL